MPIPEGADFIRADAEATAREHDDPHEMELPDSEERDAEVRAAEQQQAELSSREKTQKEHERRVTELPDPADSEAVRRHAEAQVEHALGTMPRWVQGAMDVPRGETAAETERDVSETEQPGNGFAESA